MEKKIKEIRVKLDGLTFLTKELKPIKTCSTKDCITCNSINSDRIIDTIRSLELSKMWLGKVLKELGITNPYPESKNPANEKIEPTADTANYIKTNYAIKDEEGDLIQSEPTYNNMSHIQKVKWLRAEIEIIEIKLKKLHADTSHSTYEWEYSNYSILYCIEAGMWLGMELGRIRDQQTNDLFKTTKEILNTKSYS